jgi:hypothetical protein
MNAASVGEQERALLIARLAQPEQGPRPIDVASLELGRRHADIFGGAYEIGLAQVDEAVGVTAFRTPGNAAEAELVHVTRILRLRSG